ncbi:MAG: NYN domain-containing protein [Gammaproteobacteria bacterium]|nr:NYN domain-containing protein [Gammaproteobacteria bacterium]
MDRVAVFVDAGYLFAEGARALAGRKVARSDVSLDHMVAVGHLARFARGKTGMPLLRIYWYDASANRPTRSHVVLAEQADVKLRLGRVDAEGRQKGVDALIASDLVALARNRAMADCVLLSGDDDLRIAVSEIQALGVRVHLVGICPAPRTQSRLLRQEADSTSEWGADMLKGFMHCRPRSTGRIDVTRMAKDVDTSLRGTRPHDVRRGHAIRDMARQVARQVLTREFASRTGRYP